MSSVEYNDASGRLPFDPHFDISGEPLPDPIAVQIQESDESEIDPVQRIIAPTATLHILKKCFDFRSTPTHTLMTRDQSRFVDMEEVIIDNSDARNVDRRLVLIEALNDVRMNYRLVIPTTSVREILARLIMSYANYIQSIWGVDRGDPLAYIYYHYFSSETAQDDTLLQYINVPPDSFMNEFTNRSLDFESESMRVESLYNEIIESYNVIVDSYMPFEQEDIDALTDQDIEFLSSIIGGREVDVENIIDAVTNGLTVIHSDPIHTDYKISGDLFFVDRDVEDGFVGPNIEALIEYSRIIEDPYVDTVSTHVLVSNYPHLGHIAKYISPTSNGMYMYEFMKTSETMPLIVYTDGNGQRFYKVHEASSRDIRIFSKILMKDTRTYDELINEKSDYKDESVGRGAARVAVRREQHSDDHDTIQMIYLQDLSNPQSAVNIILNTLDGSFQSMLDAKYDGDVVSPFLRFSNLQPVQYSGYFNIYGIPFNDLVFNDLVVTDPSLSELVTISEVTNLSIDKLTMTYGYRTPTREQLNKIGFGSLTVPEIRFTITSTLNNDVNMAPLGVPKLIISYSKVNTEDQLNAFVEFMKSLVVYVYNKSPEILDIYSQYIDVDTPVQTMSNREKLAAINPELFGRLSGYSTTCSGNTQPTYIDMDDPNDFDTKVTNNPIIRDGVEYPRTYLTYPRDHENQVTVTCLDDAYPYVSLKVNNRYPDRADYEYVPCCVKYDRHVGHQLAMRYQETGQILSVDTPIEDLINARILNPGVSSILEYTNIIYIVNDYLKLVEDSRIVPIRIGIRKSNRSLLEACNWILYDNESEITMEDVMDAVDLGILNLEVCRQECYDMTTEEIRTFLEDPDNIIDSRRFYRLFEEIFNVNIYVFEVEANMEFQVPRHRRYHVRANRQRSNLFLIQNMVSGVPQYEPIIYHQDVDGELNIFSSYIDESFSDDIYQLYRMSNRTLDDQFNEVAEPKTFIKDLEVRSQILDQYGRLAALVYPSLTMFVHPPNQPMNLPIADENLPVLDEVSEGYEAISMEFVGDTDEISRQGIWYIRGHERYFFPVSTEVELAELTLLPYPNLMVDEIDRGFRFSYRENRMRLSTVLQLIMMVLDRYYPNDTYVPDDLFEYTDREMDDVYDVSRIPQILPEDITWEFAESICEFIRSSPMPTILIHRDLEDGFYYYLDRRMRLNLRQGNVIRDRYEFQIPTEDTLKFSSELEFVQWNQSLEYDAPIVESVVAGTYNSLYPYIYRRGSEYRLIQPIYSRDGEGELRATYVSQTWMTSGINLGYFTSLENIDIEPGIPSSISDNRIDDMNADYFSRHDRYYAILPL